MSYIKDNLQTIISGVAAELEKFGFAENAEFRKYDDNAASAVFAGEKGAIKFEYDGKIIAMYQGDNEESTTKKIAASLMEENADLKDVKYIINEFADTLTGKFSVKTSVYKKNTAKTAAQTVSKNAVKNGSSYDANTLASKLCLVFPELRPMYKENLDRYGEFLGEEFFEKYGTAKVIAAIKENNPQTMKKLFQVLNEIYEDGTNDTQSLIAVSILGELNNDQILLARCVDYMSETMAPPVIEVNKYLASAAGKKAKKRLTNPPAYKPKKQKKPGMFAQAMAQSGGMPPM